jgi:hypothetical protein
LVEPVPILADFSRHSVAELDGCWERLRES